MTKRKVIATKPDEEGNSKKQKKEKVEVFISFQ